MMKMGAEALLSTLEYAVANESEPPDGWLTSLATLIEAINSSNDPSRIERMIDRLRDVVFTVARETQANAYGLTIGFPFGVGATFEWSRERSLTQVYSPPFT